jgi:hypothetical protein
MRRIAHVTSAFVLLLATLAYAVNEISWNVTVVSVDQEAKSMTVTYEPSPFMSTEQYPNILLWDEKTKFIQGGSRGCPDETGTPTTAAAIEKDAKLYVTAADSRAPDWRVEGGKFWLVCVKILP